ncbi:MAG: hypothetical protein RLZZ127_3062 [Planctomycetota bacterium]|jgi:uncharacterized protein (TIGR00251 family)
MPDWLQPDPAGCRLRILAQPGARREGVVGVHGDQLKVAVRAPPEDGRANAALEELLGGLLGCRCTVVQGHGDRRKTVACACAPGRALALAPTSG